MTVKRYVGDRFTGLSTDALPTDALEGSVFFELDTGLIFQYYSSSWAEISYLDVVDLDTTYAANTVDVTNTAGTDATLNSATTSLAGVMSSSDKTKLDGIELNAEVNQNAFGSVAVSGQTTVTADQETDILTLVAGSNITISTDAGTDSVTIDGTDTQLSEEEVQDFAWNVLTGTQTLIDVTYDDANNNVDFVVNDDLSLYDNTVSDFIADSWPNIVGNPASFDTRTDLMNTSVSSGVTSGCDITDNGDGTVDIASGVGLIRSSADRSDNIYTVEVPAQTAITLTDSSINYIYLDWNGGTPQFSVTTSPSGFNCIDACLAYVLHRDGTVLDILDARQQNIDADARLRSFLFETSRFNRAGDGSVIGHIDRYLTVTSGKFYFMLAPITHGTFDTSIAGTNRLNVFRYYYRDGVGGWTTLDDQKQVDNTNYDDGSGTLAPLGNNEYGVHWVYLTLDDDPTLEVVYGQDSYNKLSRALDSSPPSNIPNRLNVMGILIGRVIIQKNATSIELTESAFSSTFGFTGVTEHNDLAGLQGGLAGERYHLTGTQHTRATNFFDGGTLTHTGIETSLNNKLEDITGESIGDLQDVLIATPVDDHVLFYQSGDWVNRAITESDISDLGTYDNYVSWDLWVDGSLQDSITSGEEVNFVGGTNVTLGYSATNNTITINAPDTTLSEEEVQDFAWNVLTGTQTLINVTYDDANNEVDFVVNDDLSLYDNTTSGFLTAVSSDATLIGDGTSGTPLGVDESYAFSWTSDHVWSKDLPTLTLDNTEAGGRSYSLGVDGGIFSLYDDDASAYRFRMFSDGKMAIGDSTTPTGAKLYIRSSTTQSGDSANVDMRARAGNQESTAEVQRHDFDTSFKSAFLQYTGETDLGLTYLDTNIDLHDSARLVFQGSSSAAIYTSSGTPFLAFGADNVEKMRLSSSGLNILNAGELTVNNNAVLTTADEGSGNGLDADLLDGQEGSYYLDYNNFTNTPTYDNYSSWALWVDGTLQDDITSGEEVNFVGGTNVTLSYSATNNTVTIDASGTGLTSVTSDVTLTGDGTGGSPLGVDTTHAFTWTSNHQFNASVGIGTSPSSSYALDVLGNSGIRVRDAGVTNARYRLQNTNTANEWIWQADDGGDMTLTAVGSGSNEFNVFAGGGIEFRDSNNDITFAMDSNGNVGLHEPSPTEELDVNGTTTAKKYIGKDTSNTKQFEMVYNETTESVDFNFL